MTTQPSTDLYEQDTCPICNGEGTVLDRATNGLIDEQCPACDGEGMIAPIELLEKIGLRKQQDYDEEDEEDEWENLDE